MDSAPACSLDVDALYRALARKLENIVRREVRAADPVIEDACQFAWSRLLHHADNVQHECALAWLVRTATREALKALRREARCLSLEDASECWGPPAGGPGPIEICEQRLRLATVADLPERQQRVLWMHALGLSYGEIAVNTGYSLRTVERQLLRAKRTMRQLAAA
jgi:RNA polymerase sigma factor (sigma-70 family)